MDKLEKALEKARQQRQQIGGGLAASLASSLSAALTPSITPNKLHAASTGGGAAAAPALMTVEEAQFERHRILAHRTRSPEADVFRILRTQILQIMQKSGYRTLAITSANYGDGKTTVALNLATSIALDLKQTVLLVDLDLRKPNLHEFLGLNPDATGLSDHLLHDTPIPQCLVRPGFERLSFLPGGKPLDHSSEVLGSPKMAALAHELKNRYRDRLIIYDMPPALAQDDPIAFLPHVDAVLLIVRDGVTTINEIKRSLERLASANLIGTVLNNSRD